MSPSKRPHDRSTLQPDGKTKRPRRLCYQLQPLRIPPGIPVFRILCLITKTGSVLGHGGSIIAKIRRETGAKVRLEQPLEGDRERVIVIVGADKKVKRNNNNNKEDGKDDNIPGESEKVKEDEEKNEDKVSSAVVDTQLGKEVPSVLKALLFVFERTVVRERESNYFYARLLVTSSQVACITGNEGKLIRQMESESMTNIRVLRDKLPKCASACDAVVQLTGKLEAVRKALQLVSQQLLENPPHGHDASPTNKAIGPLSYPSVSSNTDTHHPPNFQFPAQAPLYSSGPQLVSQQLLENPPHGHDASPTNKAIGPLSYPSVSSNTDTHHPPTFQFPAQAPLYSSGPQDGANYHLNGLQSSPGFRKMIIPTRTRHLDITFRLFCPNEKIGGVIGNEGTIVKIIHLETGCDIRTSDALPYSEDHIIVISGPVKPDDTISAVQNAVLRVQDRIARGVLNSIEKTVMSRIILSSNQICFLLGNGGSIIAEIRRFSGAYIHIVPKNQIPKCFAENEEIVQITGEFKSVQEALLQITSWLQQHLFRDAFSSVNHPVHPSFQDQAPPFPCMGRREPLPPGMYSTLGGLPPLGCNHPQDDQSTFAHNTHRQGFPHISGGILLAQWEPQGIPNVGVPMGISEYSEGAPHSRRDGFGGGNQPAVFTNTTAEVSVPRAIGSSVY